MDGFEYLGIEEEVIGFDFGGLFQAAGGVAQYGVSAAEQAKKEKEDAAAESKKLADVLAADVAASNAVAKADVSAQLKSASAGIDATAAQMATDAQDRAGSAGLSAATATKRADAADKALAAVVSNAQKKPTDAYAQALVKAWKTTVNKAHSTAISSGASESGLKGYGGESWFTRKVVGPLPGAAVLAIGAGVLGAAALIVKKVFFK